MPRIYDSASDPQDYCVRCFPSTEEKAFAIHGHSGDGPDGRGNCFGYDCEHPPYDEDRYHCANVKCQRRLTGRDDLSAADLKAIREERHNR